MSLKNTVNTHKSYLIVRLLFNDNKKKYHGSQQKQNPAGFAGKGSIKE